MTCYCILIAHELGHAVLHTKIAMMKGFQEMEVLDGRSQDEDEANFFAAELLLEDKEVLECLSNILSLKPLNSFMFPQHYWTINSAFCTKRRTSQSYVHSKDEVPER